MSKKKLKGPKKHAPKVSQVHSVRNSKIKHQVTDPVAQFKVNDNEKVQSSPSQKKYREPVYENFSIIESSLTHSSKNHEDEIQRNLSSDSVFNSDSAKEYVNLKQIDEPIHVKNKDAEWESLVEEVDYETLMLKNDLADLKIHVEYVGKSLVKKLTTYASKRLQEKNYTSPAVQVVADNLVELERHFLSDIKTPNDILRETDTFK